MEAINPISITGKAVVSNFEFHIEILDTKGWIPPNLRDNFREWVMNLPLKYGTGQHLAYYRWSDNHKENVGVIVDIQAIKPER